RKSRKRYISLGVAALLVAIAGVIAMPYIASGAPNDAMIYLRRGTDNAALKDSLTSKLGDKFASRVIGVLNVVGDVSKRQGAFKVTKGSTPLSVAKMLRSGSPVGVKFTFNNVRTKQEWAQRASRALMADSAEWIDALNNTELCKRFGMTTDNVTAMLMADSYEFYWDVTPEKLLTRMHDYYTKFWNADRKSKAEKLGLKPDQVAIIASIVEEETAKADERGKVGRLYVNRVQKKMRLQADPTVKFAIGDFSIRRLTNAMTQYDSPYNTYRIDGLPPGPIRLPEKTTIDAILNSQPHNYLYMCAKEDFSGYHNFAVTLAEHSENARRYHSALNARGIR
ncbi:MAG: endolytic transglycosylase MltG, partial [Muribaculaceae bacterium]|nr:endolytic transglycosylase MltG [Muribaculaceae bacterium]